MSYACTGYTKHEILGTLCSFKHNLSNWCSFGHLLKHNLSNWSVRRPPDGLDLRHVSIISICKAILQESRYTHFHQLWIDSCLFRIKSDQTIMDKAGLRYIFSRHQKTPRHCFWSFRITPNTMDIPSLYHTPTNHESIWCGYTGNWTISYCINPVLKDCAITEKSIGNA